MLFAAAAAAAILSSAVASASASPVVGGGAALSAADANPYVATRLPSNLPTTGQDWITLDGQSDRRAASGLEFQPNDFADEDPETARRLRAIRDRSLYYFAGEGDPEGYSKQFIDGGETYYDEYSQAWRLLGFYIDCDSPYEREGDCDGGGGGGDDNDEGGVQYDENGNIIKNCARYLLWAAYIDLDYQGEGIGEYQFFDRFTGEWDTSSCTAGNGRCAKYDCHLSDTNFKLLGLFKEPNYHEWMEQTFKHEGVCVWTEDEYSFMQGNRGAWPCGCTQTDVTDADGNYVYYDMKPLPEGRVTFGLYTDASCSAEYSGDLDPVEVIENMYGNGGNYNYYYNNDKDGIDSLAAQLDAWNSGWDVFKQCQPCKAYDLGNQGSGYNMYYQNGYNMYDEYGDAFSCEDDAGYTSVNQCMKFATHTKMFGANFRDVALASDQGTITEINMLGDNLGSGGVSNGGNFSTKYNFFTGQLESLDISPRSTHWFLSSLVALAACFVAFFCAQKAEKQQKSSAREPLVPKVPNSRGFVAGEKKHVIVPRSEPANPLSSFGLSVGSMPPDGRTVLTEDWSHPQCALKRGDIVLSVNGRKVFDPVAEKVLLPRSEVLSLIRATKPGQALKLDILRPLCLPDIS